MVIYISVRSIKTINYMVSGELLPNLALCLKGNSKVLSLVAALTDGQELCIRMETI
jgi:hypothetical protein